MIEYLSNLSVFGWVNLILSVVGGATLVLNIIAPMTKNKKDDKVLYWLKLILSKVALNVKDETLVVDKKLTIKLKR